MNETQRFSSTQLQVLLDIMGKSASLDDILNAFSQSTPQAVDTVLPTLDFFVLRALANINTVQNAYLLDHLARMENLPRIARNVPLAVQTIRLLVAQNSLTSKETLAWLAGDISWEVRRGVAKNKKTPAVVLARLANDTEYPVRRNVAGHANVPEELLFVLAKDKHPRVRGSVCKNKKTPVEIKVATVLTADAEARRDIARGRRTVSDNIE